jgi:hypothetical protein
MEDPPTGENFQNAKKRFMKEVFTEEELKTLSSKRKKPESPSQDILFTREIPVPKKPDPFDSSTSLQGPRDSLLGSFLSKPQMLESKSGKSKTSNAWVKKKAKSNTDI